jgi:hypothetical protein
VVAGGEVIDEPTAEDAGSTGDEHFHAKGFGLPGGVSAAGRASWV